MNSFVIRFHDETPDQELVGVCEIVVARGKMKFIFIHPDGEGLARKVWKIEQIAYIEVGNG